MSSAQLAEKIYEAAQVLPDALAQEAFDFICFLTARTEMAEHQDLQNAQQITMNHIWDNPIDEAWNHV